MAPPIAARRLTNFPASRRSASTAQSPKSTTLTKIFMSAQSHRRNLFTDDLLNVIKDSILVRQVKSGMKIPRSLGKGARLCMLKGERGEGGKVILPAVMSHEEVNKDVKTSSKTCDPPIANR